MELVYFVVTGIALWFVADWLLGRIESMAGRRLEQRSVVFLFLYLVLLLSAFYLIQLFLLAP